MWNEPTSVMIFAAGFGTRMGSLTKDLPKPLVNVAGRPMIDYALDLVHDFGAKQIVANLHYKADMLRSHLSGENVEFSEEYPEILDTGGGLKSAISMLGDGPVFTMNSDAIWVGPNPLQFLARTWDPSNMDALLLCVPIERCVGHAGLGDFAIGTDGALSRGPGHVYSGLQIIKLEPVKAMDETVFSLNKVWNAIEDEKRLFGAAYPGQWCDVGHPEGLSRAEALIEARHA